MKKSLKTGILALLLMSPVFVLLFLYGFGENKFGIPVYFAYDSVKTDGRYAVTDAHTIPDFKFITNQGDSLSNKDLSGNIYVVDFFFSRCPGICKDMSSQMMRVQESYKDNAGIKILSFTVDPEYDTPETLDKYAKAHRAIKDKWYFLTGEKDSIYDLAKKGFFLNALEDGKGGEFIHDNHFALVDKKGWIRGFYDGTDKKDVDRLITEIAILEKEYADGK
jgi:protein SCO1/2